jgi:hypothetical protein
MSKVLGVVKNGDGIFVAGGRLFSGVLALALR